MKSQNILHPLDGVMQNPQILKRIIIQNLSKLHKLDNERLDEKNKDKLKAAKRYNEETGIGN